MIKFTPYLFSEDARSQATFYTEVLGGEIQSIMTHGEVPGAKDSGNEKVVHLCVVAGGITFFMSDFMDDDIVIKGNNVHFNLQFVDEAEAHDVFNKLSDGGTIMEEMRKEFWGDLYGRLTDKYGIDWMITCTLQPS